MRRSRCGFGVGVGIEGWRVGLRSSLKKTRGRSSLKKTRGGLRRGWRLLEAAQVADMSSAAILKCSDAHR